jgi:hypothetical protein
MQQVENHKGSLCIHRFQQCEEGFCAECIIHHDIMHARLVQESVRVPDIEEPRKEMALA